LVDNQFANSDEATIYRPLTPAAAVPERGDVLSVNLAIHTGPALSPGFANRLGAMIAAIDPALRVDDIEPLSDVYFFLSLPDYIFGSMPALVALGVLLFATVGIYTQMSFDVVHRRREIGIRSALGASPRNLVLGIFRSVFVPASIGVALGGLTALLLNFYLSPLLFSSEGGRPLPWILPAAEAFVLLMGFAAVCGPVRRTLQVDATEALRQS
jgi:ABC-type antimicrobial peptide transport system permease subunit